MLIFSLPFISLTLFSFRLEKLVYLLFFALINHSFEVGIVSMLEVIFLIFTKGIELTDEVDVFAFEALVHITVVYNLFNIILKV